MKQEIRISGFGGQGIIKSGLIIGRAAALYDGRNSTFTQSYGPEARGGACTAGVIISDEAIDYPFVQRADILVVLSQNAYDEHIRFIKEDGVFFYDPDLVEPTDLPKNIKAYKIEATRIAEKLGNKVVANAVMLGFLTAVSKVVTEKSMLKSLADSIPEKFLKLNQEAFQEGLKHGRRLVGVAGNQN